MSPGERTFLCTFSMVISEIKSFLFTSLGTKLRQLCNVYMGCLEGWSWLVCFGLFPLPLKARSTWVTILYKWSLIFTLTYMVMKSSGESIKWFYGRSQAQVRSLLRQKIYAILRLAQVSHNSIKHSRIKWSLLRKASVAIVLTNGI